MKYPVFDGHCDTAVELYLQKIALADNSLAVNLRRSEKLNGYLQFFAFCTAWMEDEKTCEERFSAISGSFFRELEINSDRVMLCRSAFDAETSLAANKVGAFLSVEGAEAIGCDAGKLAALKSTGFSMLSLTWNYENALSGSCESGGGLTDRGKEFCTEAQKRGILLDVSHLSEQGFWDLCELTEKPFAASHSDAGAIFDHCRNLTDEQFSALCQLNGAVGINLYSEFLRPEGQATVDDVYRHIDHFMELGGDGHVCLGADFDGCESTPAGLGAIDDYGTLEQYLRQRGYREQTLYDLFCGTWMRMVKECVM